jgi:hypothetical protein
MQPDIASNPEVRELAEQTDQLLQIASSYRVTTAAEYTAAGEELKKVKAAAKRLDEIRKSMTKPLDAAKRAIMDFFREPETKLQRAESDIKRAMIAYSEEQERIRREEQRKAEEAARKEREKLEAQAAKAAAAGKIERAEQLEQRAATVVAPVIQREAPKVTGLATREVWKFEIIDASALPREYLTVDEKKIGAVVRALKGDTNIPGVRVWAEKSLAAGAA